MIGLDTVWYHLFKPGALQKSRTIYPVLKFEFTNIFLISFTIYIYMCLGWGLRISKNWGVGNTSLSSVHCSLCININASPTLTIATRAQQTCAKRPSKRGYCDTEFSKADKTCQMTTETRNLTELNIRGTHRNLSAVTIHWTCCIKSPL